MTYNFLDRLDRLGTRMKDLHDNTMTYVRKGFAEITINNFTPEKLDVELMMALGIPLVVTKGQSFVFDTADLADLRPPEPKTGDKITWDGKEFEILAVDGQEFRFTTASRNRVRIFTQQIGPRIAI